MTRTSHRRNADLAKIHMGAKALGLLDEHDDGAYRDMLWAVARVRSAAQLDQGGRELVLRHLHGLGWNGDRSRTGRRSKPRGPAAFIWMLWLKLAQKGAVQKGSEAALRAYVKHQSATYHPQGVGYDAPELLPPDVASKVIEHMKLWAKREGVDW